MVKSNAEQTKIEFLFGVQKTQIYTDHLKIENLGYLFLIFVRIYKADVLGRVANDVDILVIFTVLRNKQEMIHSLIMVIKGLNCGDQWTFLKKTRIGSIIVY